MESLLEFRDDNLPKADGFILEVDFRRSKSEEFQIIEGRSWISSSPVGCICSFFKNISSLFAVLVTLPVTTATSERSFSTL